MKRKKTKADEVSEAVSNFPTKNKEGFTDSEMKQLCELFKIEEKKLNTALGTNTVIMIDGEIITYHCDVEMALICCVYQPSRKIYESIKQQSLHRLINKNK